MIDGFYPVKEIKLNNGEEYHIPQNQLKDYNIRVVRSGNTLEIYRYDNKVFYNYEDVGKKTRDRVKKEDWNGKEERNLTLARRNIRRLIWCNKTRYTKFLTLTYAEDMQDREQVLYDFKIFCKNMARKGYKLNYLYVLEHQKERGKKYDQGEGAIHIHLVIFNNEFIPWEIIKASWGKGNIEIEKGRDVKDLAVYVCKYLTKDTLAEYNSRSYSASKGLNRPIERKITLKEGDNLIQELLGAGEVVYQNSYNILCEDIITNHVEYSQIHMRTN